MQVRAWLLTYRVCSRHATVKVYSTDHHQLCHGCLQHVALVIYLTSSTSVTKPLSLTQYQFLLALTELVCCSHNQTRVECSG